MSESRIAIRLEDGTLKCRKCLRVMGQIRDGLLVVGNIVVWNEARYSCLCGRSYYYEEQVPKDEAEGVDAKPAWPKSLKAVREILNELGLDNKHYKRSEDEKASP